MKVIFLVSCLLLSVTGEYVSGYDNTTYPINVNGTTFYIYDSIFPVNYAWIYIRDTCTTADPKTCAYMGDNYCCGTWTIDSWYETDLKQRIADQAYGDFWYGDSFFNSYSGF